MATRKKPLPSCRILSVRQPWAWAIAAGIKGIENRTWSTPFEGVLFIHAGQRVDAKGIAFLKDDLGLKLPSSFETGAVVGAAALVACIDVAEMTKKEIEETGKWLESVWQAPFAEGPVLWVLPEGARLKEPVPMKGKVGLWTPEPALAERLFSLLPAKSPLRSWNPESLRP